MLKLAPKDQVGPTIKMHHFGHPKPSLSIFWLVLTSHMWATDYLTERFLGKFYAVDRTSGQVNKTY